MSCYYKGELTISDYVITLKPIYDELRTLLDQQIEKDYSFTPITIAGQTYDIDLTTLDFNTVPVVRIGININTCRLFQYIPPGPVNPSVLGATLAKLIYLSRAVDMCFIGGYSYIGDANLPLDRKIETKDGRNVIEHVLTELRMTPLNN